MAELPKNYEPQTAEPKWYARWLERGDFRADPASHQPAYSIVIPPPNVTGVLTLGHVLNNTIQDILARRARMLGKAVFWLPGTDHAGIATQTVVERSLKKNREIRHRDDLGRDKFLEKVWEWKERHGGIIIRQLQRLGASCDWSRERFTMDDAYSRCVQQVFVDLYEKGLIYRGKRMVNWCPVSLTALSDEEVVMKPQNGVLYYFKVQVAEAPDTWLPIATTRPETIPGDTAIAVNPKDPRYAHLIGKHAIRPLPVQIPDADKLIPILGDPQVDFEFGTGVLKVTPAHDKADFEIGQRHGLPAIDVMNPDGTMNDHAGESLVGLDRFEARAAAVEHLRALGALDKEEPYQNNVGFSERADVPVEPRLSEQWFLKYPSRDSARRAVADGTIRFFPERWAKVYDHWMENLQDWCISRQLWWGHRIPVWYRNNTRAGSPAEDVGGKLEARPTGDAAGNVGRASSLSTNPQQASGLSTLPIPSPISYDEFSAIDVSRRNLPHWEQENATYFVTFRLADSLPADKLSLLEAEREAWLATHPEPWSKADRQEYVERFQAGVEAWLDAGHGSCVLARADIAEIVADTLRHFDGERYHLGEFVIMPNHVHVLLTPEPGQLLGAILHSWKSYSANKINAVLGKSGQLWQHESFDHIVRNEEALCAIERYIRGNPGKMPGRAGSPAEDVGDKLEARPTGDAAGNVGRASSLSTNPPQASGLADLDIRCQIESPGEGWTQDPDVLDTWFSSWLWPFATMGWPEKTDALKKFYPTTDLVTGPDIIFFWVARMIMAGYEWMGEAPFHNVYFTGIIRDKQGRKMSKSLGNSPDPLDLIDAYGADALRFGVMRSAPLGQDILFDEKNVELGRNFCTKLWNACRFRQMMADPDEFSAEGEIDPARLTTNEKWILLRLDAAIREVGEALDEYRFSDATATLYRFLWSEFCDWFLEASKASLQSGDAPRKANTLAVIDFVLGHTLRLFHPFLPFITEELWHGLGFQHDLPPDQGGDTIQFAHWPTPLDEDFKAHYGLGPEDEAAATAKHDTVLAGRGLRRDAKLASNKRVRFVLKPAAPLPGHETEEIRILLNADPFEVDPAFIPAKGTPAALTPLGELFLPLDGLVDVDAERARLDKEIARIAAELDKAKKKLGNASFVNNAPAAVVEEHRTRERDFSEKLGQLEKMRDALEG